MTTSDHASRPLPEADGDFYQLARTLPDDENEIRLRVRAFMEKEVQPIINEFWMRDEFPFELLPKFKALGIAGLPFQGYGCPGKSTTLMGFVMMELARVDASISTFFGVHTGLAMGSIAICGSDEQKRTWLPPMAALDKIGSFGLTEPLVGSGASGGLLTSARRDGDTWILNGQKKWIGNATWGDVTVIWARDVADNQVKGFIVENRTPGFHVDKIQHKMALRVVQNGLITMTDCRVAEANRLQNANSFKDTAQVLKMTRAAVAWESVGCATGAYEHALRYAQERQQFGRPIASFQLVQDLLFRMLCNITSTQALCHRLSQMQDAGIMQDEHASLAKGLCTVRMRETVGWARELLGANGILLDHHVGRFVADAEALYSYEGTREMNALIVGRAVTGFSAFV
ncbi:acyl-CoA dehydrogenase family protein [Burkholderia lata]|uniref:acyl-CoA dehydrogenase family protein n=1 Tax=Burkholderia lata (strain ATCC 17760 / DSM 23089 / LMG 22485 / NCIMB 9086 / R18194 / 383) TaxID=482957 RepID=UPI00145396DA|nr:acyl-CoA dehydrogenase family protein [Burkholderia lata]VWM13718.1 acyl-CoA dehydrogenase [Burkholderia lata]